MSIALDDVVIDTFCQKLAPRVAVKGRIVKKPEPRVNWELIGVLLANVTVWIVILGVGSMMWVAL